MKRILAFLMAFSVIFALSCPAYAATIEIAKTAIETTRGKQIETNINGLLEDYKMANNEDQQVAIFNELVECYSELDNMEFYRSSIAPLVSNYVTINGTPSVTNNRATISYTVHMAIPNGAAISVGFEYPSDLRQLPSSFIPQNVVGTHTKTISTNIIIGARYFVKLKANTYTDKQPYGIYYANLNTNGVWNEKTHLVTEKDERSNEIATSIAPFFVCKKLFLVTAGTKTLKTILEIKDVSIIIDTIISPIKLTAGNYIVSAVKLDGNTMHFRCDRYRTYASYSSGENPLETSRGSYTFTGYPQN